MSPNTPAAIEPVVQDGRSPRESPIEDLEKRPFDDEKHADSQESPQRPALRTETTDDEQTREKPELERWNQSKENMFRYSVTLYSFVLLGMNDACIGALIPYLEEYYNLSYSVVSLMFLVPFVGYVFAGLLNETLHHYFGQKGVAILAPLSRLLSYVPIAFHPPFAAVPPLMVFTGFGAGILDSAWNAWIGNMQNANELLGFLHGAYGLGGTLGPLIATTMVTKGGLPWYSFFYVLIGMAVLEEILCAAAFWRATAAAHRAAQERASGAASRTSTRAVLREPITWILAVFLLGYVGAEVSMGGWITTFMLRVRHADAFDAGLTVTYFWMGLTVGRVTLGFVTGRIGEKLAISAYLLICIALQLLYWLVPSYVASVVFVSLLGFFLGPLFPAAMVAAAKLLPVNMHVSAIGFAAAVGGSGAAILPFAVGAIAQSKGVQVLQPIVLAVLAFILVIWWTLPGGFKRGGLEQARENKEPVALLFREGSKALKERITTRVRRAE